MKMDVLRRIPRLVWTSSKRVVTGLVIRLHTLFKQIPLYRWLDDFVYTIKRYRRVFGRYPNLIHPKTFNEHINRKKLFDHNPLLTMLADKYEVRQYVRDRIGEQYLAQLYLVTDTPNDIDFTVLPDDFVIKATHGCAMCIIVPDKSQANRQQIIAECNKWLDCNYYEVGHEWVYKDIPPRIIIEEFLGSAGGVAPNDFKFFCFGGTAKFVQVNTDRFSSMKLDIYDINWNRLDVTKGSYANLDLPLPAPPNLEHMIRVAQKLAEGLDFVRVDLYNVEGQIYFGEMTHYPANGFGGFDPERFDMVFGSHWPTDSRASHTGGGGQ